MPSQRLANSPPEQPDQRSKNSCAIAFRAWRSVTKRRQLIGAEVRGQGTGGRILKDEAANEFRNGK